MKKSNVGKSNKKSKKKALAVASSLGLVALLSGTFAWLTVQDQRVNRLESLAVSDGSVSINEEFTPTPIQPGAEAQKDISVTNSGNAPVFVRASFEEVLKSLKSQGIESGSATAWTAKTANESEKQGIGYDMPVIFDAESAKYTGTEWKDVSSKVTGLPDNVVVKAKGSYKLDAGSNKEILDYTAIMYTKIKGLDGKDTYQKVTGNLQVNDMAGSATVEGTDPSSWTFTIVPSTIQYLVYAGGYDATVANWATTTLADANGDFTGAALLGTEGTRYGTTYNYKNTTDGGFIPDANLVLTPQINPKAPTPADPTTNILADKVADNQGLIQLSFHSANILDPATAAKTDAKKWVYNSADGWFYYMSPLKSGETTESLLEKVVYSSKIETQYANSTYDLVAKIEAVQALPAALADNKDGGFALSDTGLSKVIKDSLTDKVK